MDLRLIDSGNGGDLIISGRDLQVVYGFENMIYLALFGGNLFGSVVRRIPGEQAFDYWGNSFIDAPNMQFDSLTERTLTRVALNSSGRAAILQAVKSDLSFLGNVASMSVSASITESDVIEITIQATEKANQETKDYLFVWDSVRQSLSADEDNSESSGNPAATAAFDYAFDLDLI